MHRVLALALAAVLLFGLSAAASARGNVTYSDFHLAGIADGVGHFTVSRTLPDDNDPVAWVYVVSDDGVTAMPVIWGLWDSPTGYADVPLSGHGTAWLTVTPQKPRHTDPSIAF